MIESFVFFMCFLTSAACAGLLFRGWQRNGTRLLFWSAVCFGGLTLNNLLVFFDLVLLPNMDLRPYRQIASFAAVAVLVWSCIWDTE